MSSKKIKNKILYLTIGICKSQERGFSIGEVMLSVFILGVTMVAILGLYSSGLREFQDERDSVIASMLAQEGVELVRNIRDNNWAKRTCAVESNCEGEDTFPETFANFPSSDAHNCRIDKDFEDLIECNGSSYALNIDGSGFYVHSVGTSTKFRRTMDLNYDEDTGDLIVTSFVSWNNSNPATIINDCTVNSKCVFSQATLTNWGTGT